jgi:signal transduction histidine kinase
MLAIQKRFAIISMIFILSFACNDNKPVTAVFVKEAPASEDPIVAWLKNDKNYRNNKNYLPVFYKHYNAKIAEKNYLQAAKILDVVSVKLMLFYDYNQSFFATIKEFDIKYRNKVPALKTTFVDNFYGNYIFEQGLSQKSCVFFKKITALEPNDYDSCEHIARAYYNLSFAYLSMGKQNLALQANHKALLYFTKNDDLNGIACVYQNYTEIYISIKNYKKAIECNNKDIKYSIESGNTRYVYGALLSKMNIYNESNNTKTSALIDSCYTAFSKSKFDSDELKIAFSSYKIRNFFTHNQLSDAKKLLDTLKPIVKKLNSNTWTQYYEITLAEYEIENNPKKVNLSNFKKVIPFLYENKQFLELSNFYDVLKKHAIKNNDYKNALVYQEKWYAVTDSMGTSSMQTKVVELEAKYQTQKREKQIVIHEKTIATKNATIACLGFLFLMLFTIIFIYRNKQKQKQIELDNINIQRYAKQLLEKMEEERKRIASDLHDSISHDLLELKNVANGNLEETIIKIDGIINDIRSISRNLHPIMFDKIGLKASIEQMVERAQVANNFMVTADVDYKLSLSSSDELQVYRIIQEALSNIIKYADAVAAKILVTEKEKTIYIEIKDNGKGFNVKKTLNSSDAFGLHNIIERSRAIGGKAKIKSDGNGTIVSIIINKMK